MKQGWLGILFCISLIFGLSGIKDKFTPDVEMQLTALEQNSNEVVSCCPALPDAEAGATSTNNLSSRFDDFNSSICDYFTLTTLSTSPRSISCSKLLKPIHSLAIHSSLHPPLFSKNSGVQCFHYCFVEASCRYYIYTLRRIII